MEGPDYDFVRKVVEAIEACGLDEDVDQASQIVTLAKLMKLHPRDSMLLVLILTWVRAGSVAMALNDVQESTGQLQRAATMNLEAVHRLQAKPFARRFLWPLIAAGMLLSATLASYATRSTSFQTGYMEGLKASHVLRDLLISPDGKAVAGLISGGDLLSIARCDKPGWVVQDRACAPYGVIKSDGTSGGVYGWRLWR